MGDTLDIHSLLETGYFTTSRARTGTPSASPGSFPVANDLAGQGSRQPLEPTSPTSPQPGPITQSFPERQVPRTFEEPQEPRKLPDTAKPTPRPVYLPPPTVEDEAESLAKEHGSPSVSDYPDEKPQSRGEFQQESIMEEVHEHNPERRFVVVTGQPKSDSSGSDDDARRAHKEERRRSRRPTINEPKLDDKPGRRPEPSYEPVFDDRRDADIPVPVLARRRSERRKSRNELPRIDTSLRPERPSGRQRTKSAVGGPRPDFFNGEGPRQSADGMLSPEVIKHGSGRREQPYYGYGSSSSPNGRPSYPRSLSNSAEERFFEGRDYNRGSLSPTVPKRSCPNSNGGSRDSRHFSTERASESRSREDFPPPRSHRRGDSKSYGRSDDPSYRGASTGRSRESRPRREESHSSDERSRDARIPTRRRRNSVVIQDERRSMPNLENGSSSSPSVRPPSRGANLPLASPKLSVSSDLQSIDGRSGLAGATAVAAGAAGIAALDADAINGRTTTLPYPEEDYLTHAPEQEPIRTEQSESSVLLEAPVMVSSTDETPSEPTTTITEASPVATPQPSSQPWQPGSFIPERDGLPVEKPMGTYRRYSENVDTSGPPKLPECRYTKPVTGMQNWLTLPRSDFNICLGCYTAVFADTDYRTQFQPMLYAADRPIVCDFGSSPWYRIAWLLTLRSETPDLRLFYAISHIATMSRSQPCPGDRRSTRLWLTIIDPFTRRPIPNFAVCLQCAQTVEALLPNMKGIFVPLNPRSEPSRSICTLHFTPNRKEFVLYFDALETTSDKALSLKQPPDLDSLSQELEKLGLAQGCPRDDPVPDGYWHVMQYIPDFTVCEKCFGEVVRPRIAEDALLARNFYLKPQRVADATCQLYSDRMRDIFRRACRKNDAEYLAVRVRERTRKEHEIHNKLVRLDRQGLYSSWTAEQVKKLIDEWKEWE